MVYLFCSLFFSLNYIQFTEVSKTFSYKLLNFVHVDIILRNIIIIIRRRRRNTSLLMFLLRFFGVLEFDIILNRLLVEVTILLWPLLGI